MAPAPKGGAVRSRHLGLVAGVGVVGIVIAALLATRDRTPAPAAHSTAAATPAGSTVPLVSPAAPPARVAQAVAVAPSAPALDDLVPSAEDLVAARAEVSPESTAVLIAALESTDAIVVAEATNALVSRGAVSELPVLIAHDVIGRPWAAPSVIDAMGRLAKVAAPEERDLVIDRLFALLEEEKRRGAVESQGNMLQIYEALAQTGDPRAAVRLEQELLDPTVATAPKVAVVQALVALRATASRGTLARLHDELVAAAPPADAFEAELRRDLVTALRDALVALS